jgi:hypothetical protein
VDGSGWPPNDEQALTIAWNAMPYVVALLHERPLAEVQVVGSGTLVAVHETAPSRLLTATHVVNQLRTDVTFITGSNVDPPAFPVNVIASDDEMATDVALLELNVNPTTDLGKEVLVPGKWPPPRAGRGARIVSVGFPNIAVRRRASGDPINEIRLHLLFGSVTSFEHEPAMMACGYGNIYVLDQEMQLARVSAAAFAGASGGPVFEYIEQPNGSDRPFSLRLCGVHQGVVPGEADPAFWQIRVNALYRLRVAE